MPGRSLFVAALQSAGVPDDPDATLEQLERRVHAIRDLRLVSGIHGAFFRHTLASQGCCSRGRPGGR